MHDNDVRELSYSIVSNLVKYVGANQASLFLTTEKENNKYLKLIATYAYEREKIAKKPILNNQDPL